MDNPGVVCWVRDLFPVEIGAQLVITKVRQVMSHTAITSAETTRIRLSGVTSATGSQK